MKITSKLFIVLSLCLSFTNSLFAMSQEELDVVQERSCLTRVVERAKISAVRAICEVKWLIPEGIAKIRNANSISSLLGGIANFAKVPLTGLKVGLCEMFWPWQQPKVSRNAHFVRPEIQDATCKVDEESKDYVIALYQMMKDVKRAFRKEKAPYFATNGTLLGCVRNGGIIPGDDDLDVSVTEEYVEQMPKVFARLQSKGYKVVTIKNRLEYPSEVSKLLLRIAKSIFNGNIQYADRISDDVEMHIYTGWRIERWFDRPQVNDEETLPFCDIFLMKKIGDNHYYSPDFCVYHKEEVYPRQKAKFGDLTISIPNKPYLFLDREYRDTWSDHMKKYNHGYNVQDGNDEHNDAFRMAAKIEKMECEDYLPLGPFGPLK